MPVEFLSKVHKQIKKTKTFSKSLFVTVTTNSFTDE